MGCAKRQARVELLEGRPGAGLGDRKAHLPRRREGDVQVRVGQPVSIAVLELDRLDARGSTREAAHVVVRAHRADADDAVDLRRARVEPEVRLRIAGKRLFADVEAPRRIDRRTVDRSLAGDIDVELAKLFQVVPDAVVGRREPGDRERPVGVASEGGV